jgi:hypothetical protein
VQETRAVSQSSFGHFFYVLCVLWFVVAILENKKKTNKTNKNFSPIKFRFCG